jgi:hypothetical protein
VQQLRQEQATSLKWSVRLFGCHGQKASARKNQRKLARQAELLRQSGLFDEAWYLNRYPDVAESKEDVVQHYLNFGGAEGRDPSPDFSTEEYVLAYPDVAASSINPLVHYLEHGCKEGRVTQKAKR